MFALDERVFVKAQLASLFQSSLLIHPVGFEGNHGQLLIHLGLLILLLICDQLKQTIRVYILLLSEALDGDLLALSNLLLRVLTKC